MFKLAVVCAVLAFAYAAPGGVVTHTVSHHGNVVAHPVPVVHAAPVVPVVKTVPVVHAVHTVPVVKTAPVVHTVHTVPVVRTSHHVAHSSHVVHHGTPVVKAAVVAPVVPVIKTVHAAPIIAIH